jgi:hypothetical protein
VAVLKVSPPQIRRGASAGLAWQVSNANQVRIDPGIGDVPNRGAMTVHPEQSVTYRIRAVGPGGPASEMASLEVLPVLPVAPPTPVIRSFHADPSTVIRGRTFKLRWHVENATNLSIDRGIGPVTGEESAPIVATETTTFILTASRPGSDQVTNVAIVTVIEPGAG